MNNYYSRINLLTAPTIEPITLKEAKEYLGITGSDDDNIIQNWIKAVRQNVELYTGMSIMEQTWQLFLDYFPVSSHRIIYNKPTIIELPKAPLSSVTHIKHYDDDDTATTISSSLYQVSKYSAINPWQGRIAFKDSFSAPSGSSLRNMDSVEIQFISGYSTTTEVPESIKMAMLEEIGFRNKNKAVGDIESESVPGVYSVKYGANNSLDSSGLSNSSKSLLQPFKKFRI